MITKKVKITNPTGLHMRPAGIFCNKASEFECSVRFRYDNTMANAKSVLSVLGACIKSGDEIVLECEGPDVFTDTMYKIWMTTRFRPM